MAKKLKHCLVGMIRLTSILRRCLKYIIVFCFAISGHVLFSQEEHFNHSNPCMHAFNTTIDTSHRRDMQPGNVGHVCYANILVLYGLRKQLSSDRRNE